jgi:hypothetical protein
MKPGRRGALISHAETVRCQAQRIHQSSDESPAAQAMTATSARDLILAERANSIESGDLSAHLTGEQVHEDGCAVSERRPEDH